MYSKLYLFLIILVLSVACNNTDPETDQQSQESLDMPDVSEEIVIDLEDMESMEEIIDPDVDETPNTQALLEELYRWDRILNVSIVMDGESWETLRQQTRSWVDLFGGEDCFDEPFSSPFTWFKASATIDGEIYAEVDVRKKGFLGSLNEIKPSLKLDLGEYVDDQTHLGARRFTLNNAVQDPALIRQCLAYELSNQAGIPAPRCNFALVDVNGDSLGVYVNIEPYKRGFFEDHFGSYEGNVYEGTVSDFTESALGTFEAKNNDENRPNYTEIISLSEALDLEDDSFIEVLQEYVDLEQFVRFWALESLLLHSDGYSGNRNNYYLYGDPADQGRLKFLMWGADGILNAYDVAEDQPQSVYLKGILAWRLYQVMEWRVKYFEALDSLMEQLWDESIVIGRVEELYALLTPFVNEGYEQDLFNGAIEELKDVINDRRDTIETERTNDLGSDFERSDEIACLIPNGSLEAEFMTEWGMINRDFGIWFEQADQELELTVGSIEFNVRSVGSAAGTDEEYGPRLNIVGSLGLNDIVLINVSLEEENWQSGEQEVWSEIYYSGRESDFEIVYVASAFITLSLEQGSTEAGATIIGRLAGDVLSWSEE